jgi:hypothetical protein
LLIPGIEEPDYFPNGPQNSGKSSLQIYKKSLVDPYELQDASSYEDAVSITLSDLDTDPRKSWDRALEIDGNWITYFDNVSYVTHQIMDELCRWCWPGFHKSKEKKYVNKELSEIGGKRPVGLNGLVNTITQGDLHSRMFGPFLLSQDTDTDDGNIDVESIYASFFENKPVILGYMLGIVSKFLYYYEQERKTIKPKTRLKQFEVVSEILSRCIGNKPGAFQDAWVLNTKRQVEMTIENSTLAKVIIIYVQQRDTTIIEKQPEDLWKELESLARSLGYNLENDKTFPKNEVWLTRSLNRITMQLADKGIEVTTGDNNNIGDRTIRLVNKNAKPRGQELQNFLKEIAKDLASQSPDGTIQHESLHQRQVSSGKVHASEAEYNIQKSLDDGWLIKVDYHKYKIRQDSEPSPKPADN